MGGPERSFHSTVTGFSHSVRGSTLPVPPVYIARGSKPITDQEPYVIVMAQRQLRGSLKNVNNLYREEDSTPSSNADQLGLEETKHFSGLSEGGQGIVWIGFGPLEPGTPILWIRHDCPSVLDGPGPTGPLAGTRCGGDDETGSTRFDYYFSKSLRTSLPNCLRTTLVVSPSL